VIDGMSGDAKELWPRHPPRSVIDEPVRRRHVDQHEVVWWHPKVVGDSRGLAKGV